MSPLKKVVSVVLVCLTLQFAAFPQKDKSKDKSNEADSKPAPQSAATTPTAPRPALEFGLSEDTPVKLKLTRTMSSKDAKENEKVDFEVLEDIKVGGVVIVQHGAMAIATVTDAQPKRSMGRAGKLNITIDYVQLVDGEKVTLRAVKGGSGGSHTGAMTGAMVATGILFFPAAPFFLFMKGKDITIPQGTEVTAYVAADIPLDRTRFTAAALSDSPTAKAETGAASSVTVTSTPDAADISVDGKFVGTTPSTIQLAPGEHKILVSRTGFKTWERTMTVNPKGSVNLNAELEKTP